jgi:bifunctional DNA-binding transcriptional regulator/antitoxin component of YhaV-PrlF toxin-antitoxin module
MISSKVSPKGLTIIPSEIRKIMNINIGDTLVWKVEKCENEDVIHIRISRTLISHCQGGETTQKPRMKKWNT